MGLSWGWLRGVFSGLRTNHRKARSHRVTGLEDRTLLAAFSVNTLLDTVDANPGDGLALDADGNTSLRAAVMEANQFAGPHTITLGAGLYTLSLLGDEGTSFTNALIGDLDIHTDVVIEGAGAGQTVIDAALGSRLFETAFTGRLTIRNATLQGGLASEGGAILSRGFTRLENSIVTGNRATVRGGAIEQSATSATLELVNVQFTNNRADVPSVTGATSGLGGALYLAAGTATISGSLFDGNLAALEGGAINSRSTTVTINNSTFSGNTATVGGALRLLSGTVTSNDSTYIGNRATTSGGAIRTGGATLNINRGDFEDNRTTQMADWNSSLHGGAISIVSGGTTTIDGTEFRNNASWVGGAIYAFSAGVTVRNSLFEGNTARLDSTFGRGGALYAHTNASVFVINSTLVGNSSYIGGALASSGASARWVNSTVVGNNTFFSEFGASAAIEGGTLWNSIVADNVGYDVRLVTSQGGNVIGFAENMLFTALPTDLVSRVESTPINPHLLPLADNGGPTRTMALAAASPARDRGLYIAPAPTTDARGVSRSGTTLDAGAYEYQNQAPTAYVFTGGVTKHDQPLTGQLQGFDPDGDTLTFTAPYGPSIGTMVIQPNGQFTYTPPANIPGGGRVLFDFRVTDGHGGASTIVRSEITLLPNLAPTSTKLEAVGVEDEVFTGQLLATDPDGNSLTFEVAAPSGGTVNALPEGQFTFTPNANFAGTAAFWSRARDKYGAYSAWVLNTIAFAPVNDPPIVNDQTFVIDEGSINSTLVGYVQAYDLEGNYPLTGELVSGLEDGALFFNPFTGAIVVVHPELLDFETQPTRSFVVRISDSTGLSSTATITVQLRDIQLPASENSYLFVAENSLVGTSLGYIFLKSIPEPGQVLQYEIVGDTSGGKFLINSATGQVTVAPGASINYEEASSYSLTVRVSDVANPLLFHETVHTITVGNQNDAPVISSASFSVAENSAAGTSVGTVVGSDQDVGQTLTYAIVSGNPTGAFAINSTTGQITVANSASLDFEGTPTFSLGIQVTDNGNPIQSQTGVVTVTLTDVFEPEPLPPSLTVSLNGNGDLVISDISAVGRNNSLTIRNDGFGNIVISDAVEAFVNDGGISGAVLSDGNKALTVPLASITGAKVIVNGALGSDSLNASLVQSLGRTLEFHGGAGINGSLTLSGGTTTFVTHTSNSFNDGGITFVGAVTGTILYTGVEQVTDNLSSVSRGFIFYGGAETISLTDGISSDGKMTIDSTQGSSVSFTSPTGSLLIDAGLGADIVNISTVDTAFDASLTINGGKDDDVINLNADITFASGHNLDVDLQNDIVAPGTDTINVGLNANLSLSGSGSATLKASKSIALGSGSSITTVDGGVTLMANLAGVAMAGAGIRLSGGTIQTTGAGHVRLEGHGGGASGSTHQTGVIVQSGGQVLTTNGNVTIIGTGGLGGIANRGVTVAGAGSRIATVDGAISVTGMSGAWSGVGDARFQEGVKVEFGAAIEATGSGSVTIVGTGGSSGGLYNRGINIETTGSRVSVVDGNLTLTGIAGATNSSYNEGVIVWSGGIIRSSGAGNIVLTGTGGGNNSQAGFNRGVLIDGTLEATGTGSITMTGTEGIGSESFGIYVGVGYSAMTNNQAISLTADRISLAGSIHAGTNVVSLQQRTPQTQIHLGASDAPGILGLTDAELDGITAGTVQIGDANSGEIAVSQVISPANYQTLAIGSNVTFARSGGFSSDVGPTASTYERITVTGTVVITDGATLTVAATGGYVYNGTDTFTLLTNDAGDLISGTFTGPTLTNFLGSSLTAATIYTGGTGNDLVISAPPNAAPTAVILIPSSAILAENSSTASAIVLSTISVIDDDLGVNVLSLSGPDMSSFEIVGNSLQLKAGVILDFEAQSSYTVTIQVDDASLGGAPDATATFTLNVSDVNESPAIVDQNFTVAENAADGTVVGTVIAGDVDAGQSLTYSITHSAPISGAFAIDAVTGQITVANGSLLNFEGLSAFALTVTVTDNGNPELSHSAIVLVTLTDVNEAPVIADQSFTVAENTLNTNRVGFVTGSDVDAGASLTYSITSSSLPGAFAINPVTGEVTVTDSSLLDFEAVTSATLVITATDNGNPALSANATVTVAITDVNERPIIVGQNFTVAENAVSGSVVGTVVSSDVDAGQTRTYAITASAPISGAFAINASTGEITVVDGSLLNFEAISAVALTVTVTDNGNPALSSSAVVVVTLTDVNEAPVIADRSFTVAENSASGTVVGSIIASDVDGGQSLAYSITGSTLAGAFAINATSGQIAVVNAALLNFEAATTVTLTVTATDNGNPALSSSALVTISLTNVNEAPTITNQSFSVAENSASGTIVGIVVASDVDAGQSLSYSIASGNTGGAFAINAATGRITVANAAALDFETTPSFALTVRVTDNGNPALSSTATVTINLTDVIEAIIIGLDVVPGDATNTIKLTGKFDVAILSTATFDARTVNVSTIRFGKNGTEDSISRDKRGNRIFSYRDVNGDGRLDLVVNITNSLTGLGLTDTLAKFSGLTNSGLQVLGSSAVRVRR